MKQKDYVVPDKLDLKNLVFVYLNLTFTGVRLIVTQEEGKDNGVGKLIVSAGFSPCSISKIFALPLNFKKHKWL